MKTIRTEARSPEELATAFADLIEEGRDLLGDVLNKPTKKSIAFRETLDELGRKLAGYQSSATRAAKLGAERSVQAARQADRYVHDNPWPAVAGGIALGVLATLWLRQRH